MSQGIISVSGGPVVARTELSQSTPTVMPGTSNVAPFDPFLEAPKPDTSLDIEERPVGGLGVHLVKNVSAHHCYSGTDGENTIELYFKMPPDEA